MPIFDWHIRNYITTFTTLVLSIIILTDSPEKKDGEYVKYYREEEKMEKLDENNCHSLLVQVI